MRSRREDAHTKLQTSYSLSQLMSFKTNSNHPLTSEYYISSSSKIDSSKLLVFIPGNPGLIDYYVTYLGLLAESYPDFNILAISHAGFQTSDDFVKDGNLEECKFFGLDYQIDHKYLILKEQILAGNTELYFLCHSVGGYITQRVVKRLLQDKEIEPIVKIHFIGLICPTIVDLAKSHSGIAFGRLFSILPVVTAALWLLKILNWILPQSVARSIIRNFIIARPVLDSPQLVESWNNSVEATFKIYQSPRIVYQALTLAKEELSTIHRDDELNDWFFKELPASHGTIVWSFFAFKDHWVHDNTRDYILSRYYAHDNSRVYFEVGNATNEHSHAITHSFCIDQSVEFAQITQKALGLAHGAGSSA